MQERRLHPGGEKNHRREVELMIMAFTLALCQYFLSSSTSGHTHLLIGQNWQHEFYDYSRFFGQLPSGPSFYTAQLVSGQPLVWMGDGLPFVHDVLNRTYEGRGANAELTLAWKYAKDGCAAIQKMSIDIAAGLYDMQLDEMATVFNTFPKITFLLRVEYEVSYELFTCVSARVCTDQTYQHAFQHVAKYLRSKANNVRFVFHPMYGDVDAPCLYPGDDVVDIIGVSFFEGKGDACYHRQAKCVNPIVNATLAWARSNAPGKDLFFPESAPQYIDNIEWTVTFLEHMQNLVEMYDVRYWTYINMDWNKHGWGPPSWGNSRVQDSNVTADFWRRTILNSDGRYLCANDLPCGSHPSPPSPAPSPPSPGPSPSPSPPPACADKCDDKHCSTKIHYPFCCAANADCYISRQQAASAGCKLVCGPY